MGFSFQRLSLQVCPVETGIESTYPFFTSPGNL
jgi:hypothetical protein